MEILYLLEKIRCSVLDTLMLLVTSLGEETAFLVIAIVVFWCVDKKRGYYVLFVGFVGTILNQFLKLLCRVPRPWIKDPNFTIVESARAEATGYSFPSGHTQCAVGTFGALAATEKRRWLRWVYILLAALVGFSRMYLGVHTPQDVLVAAATAVILIFALRPLILKEGKYRMPLLLLAVTAVAAGYLCFVHLYPFPADVDQSNLSHGTENAYTMLGCVVGFLMVYYVDKKWLNFPVKAAWWAQIVKVVVGLCLVLAVKSGLKEPLNLLLGGYFGRAVRYFLIVLVAGILWPMSFRLFARTGRKEA